MQDTHVLLDDRQYSYLLAEGQRRGLTVSELISGFIARHMVEPDLSDDPLEQIIGIGRDAEGDAARDHDLILYSDPGR